MSDNDYPPAQLMIQALNGIRSDLKDVRSDLKDLRNEQAKTNERLDILTERVKSWSYQLTQGLGAEVRDLRERMSKVESAVLTPREH